MKILQEGNVIRNSVILGVSFWLLVVVTIIVVNLLYG